jgi:hypothetical protein
MTAKIRTECHPIQLIPDYSPNRGTSTRENSSQRVERSYTTARLFSKWGISTRENSPQRTERALALQRLYQKNRESQQEKIVHREQNVLLHHSESTQNRGPSSSRQSNSKRTASDATKTKVHKTDPVAKRATAIPCKDKKLKKLVQKKVEW